MKRRILRLLSCFLLTVGLAACNWGGETADRPSPPSSAPPASAPESGLTETQRASILDAVNGVLGKYRSGEYPREYLLAADDLYFLDSFPADSVLPESVSWEDLTVNITWDAPDNLYYTNSMDVALPLENGYRMELWGGETANGSWKIMDGGIRDLREARQFERIETESGEFTDVSTDRLKLWARVKNLDFPGLPADNNGHLSVNLVHGWVVLQLYFSDNGDFSATTYQAPPVVSGSVSPGLDDRALYDQLVRSGNLLRDAVTAQTP